MHEDGFSFRDHDHGAVNLSEVFLADGRPLIILSALVLVASGLFALFLSAGQEFLPHDIRFLGMTPTQLCEINACKINLFMFHDRVSFGGVLIAIGALYLWLSEFPLKRGEAWAWWTLSISGLAGFLSFLAYLGYGYLDSWHGIASLFLFPCFTYGLVRNYSTLSSPRSISSLLRTTRVQSKTFAAGRFCLLVTTAGIIAAGFTITTVGMTDVFVPQDLEYIGLTPNQMTAINPRMIPLIAHDRAGFGGALICCGLAMFFSIKCAVPSRSLWQILALSGGVGFLSAILIHPIIGYLNFMHLAPAILGVLLFSLGLGLTRDVMLGKAGT